MSTNESERTGNAFDPDLLMLARQKTWQAIELVRNKINVGMTEAEGRKIALETIAELGGEKNWHAPQIRFGVNTLKSFGVPSEPNVVLTEDDLYFLDFGPVFRGHEGDCGQTFCLGSDPLKTKICKDIQEIHAEVAKKWAEDTVSGQALYAFAEDLANERGWVLSLKEADGHRVSDFPHAIHHKGSVMSLQHRPSSHRWILEIQLRHPVLQYGAFYEDLLVLPDGRIK